MIGREPESWTDFITSFWAALDGRAFTSVASERAAGSCAFLSSLLECIVLLVKRSRAFSEESSDSVKRQGVETFVGQQFTRIWEELVKDRLRVQSNAAGKELARTFAVFESLSECKYSQGIDQFDAVLIPRPALFAAAWEPIASSVRTACSPQQAESATVGAKRFSVQLSLLKGLWEESQSAQEASWRKAVSTLICTTASVLIEQTREQLESVRRCRLRPADVTAPQRFAELLIHFSGLIFHDPDLPSVSILINVDMQRVLTACF